MTPPRPEDQRVYSSKRRRLVLAAGLVGIFAATVGMVLEPDPSTGLKPMPGDYLWVVIPGAILVAVLARRAMKSRIVTDGGGVDVVRVVGHEYLPWSDVRRFEVHPTPGRQGSAVVARLHDELLVKIWSQVTVRPLRNRDEARRLARQRAQELRDQLEGDRQARVTVAAEAAAGPAASGPAATGPDTTATAAAGG